jgi:sarcosine oxidase subunit gamma
MADVEIRSPLSHRSPIRADDGAASLAEWPFLTKIILRVGHAAGAVAVEQAIGPALPDTACTAAVAGARAALWLGPDEWMLVVGDAEAHPILAELAAVLGATHHQAVDVSDHLTTITVSGARSRDLLAKLITVDLHPRAFGENRVVSTLAGAANVVVWLRDDSPSVGATIDVFVRASFADYLWCLLAESGREYGMPPQQPVAGERMRR